MIDHGHDLPCPVCKGVELLKLPMSDDGELTVDYCDKCGGMWFESGEVRKLRFSPPEILSGLITVKKQLFAVPCPECKHPITRNSAKCGSCGHKNIIDCPVCGSKLGRAQSDRFVVDVCKACRGVWFDNIDLSEVWNLQFRDSTSSGDGSISQSSEPIDSMDTVIAVLRHSKKDGFKRGGASESGPPSAGGVAAAGDNSPNVFGTIADIVGGMFSGSE
ncbi:MAG: zf-TFIIB domain-containing protein [Acidobacteriota bacterium]